MSAKKNSAGIHPKTIICFVAGLISTVYMWVKNGVGGGITMLVIVLILCLLFNQLFFRTDSKQRNRD